MFMVLPKTESFSLNDEIALVQDFGLARFKFRIAPLLGNLVGPRHFVSWHESFRQNTFLKCRYFNGHILRLRDIAETKKKETATTKSVLVSLLRWGLYQYNSVCWFESSPVAIRKGICTQKNNNAKETDETETSRIATSYGLNDDS